MDNDTNYILTNPIGVKYIPNFSIWNNLVYLVQMKTTTKKYIHVALKTLGLVGLGATVIVAPNAVRAIGQMLLSVDNHFDPKETERIYRNLTRSKLVEVRSKSTGNYEISLTPAGAQKLVQLNAESIVIPQMKKWDKQWRLVCYDIPVSKNSERVELKYHLQRMGFTMLQKSMWVHPHECFEQIHEISDSLGINRYINILQVIKLDEFTTKRLLRIYEPIIQV